MASVPVLLHFRKSSNGIYPTNILSARTSVWESIAIQETEEVNLTPESQQQSRRNIQINSVSLPWSQRLSFILYWQILRREPLLMIFFYWHEALRAEKRKPLVATVGNLTFMPSAFDRRFWLADFFNCSMSHMIGWIKYLWGWEWSVYVHLYGYVWKTFALSTDSLTREG